MSDVQKQFKKLDKKALKLQRQCEKESQYIPNEKSKNFLRLILLFTFTGIIGASVFFVMKKVLSEDFLNLFMFKQTPALVLCIFTVVGILLVLFLPKKLPGFFILFLTILNIATSFMFFVDRKVFAHDIFLLFTCSGLTIISIFVLIKSYRLKKLK